MSGRPARRLTLAALALVLAGCRTPPPATCPALHEGPALRVASADDLARRVHEANDGFGTLETVHQVAIEIALGEGRSEKRSFRALLAVRRPDHFRVNLLGPMGVRLMDLLYSAGRVTVVHVATELQRSSRLGQLAGDIAGDIAAIFRLDPQVHPDRRTMEDSVSIASGRAPLYELREYRGKEMVRQCTIFAATLAIARCEQSDGQGGTRTITFGEYLHYGRLLLPRQIHLSREGRSFYWLSVRVESATVDQKLDDRLFVVEGRTPGGGAAEGSR